MNVGGILVVGVFIVIIYVLIEMAIGPSGRSGYTQRLKRYRELYIGMYEDDMLSIMGPGYSVSQLRDGTIKYTWSLSGESKIKGGGFQIGIGYTSSYVVERNRAKRVVVVVEDERVVEIRPYNV